MPLRTRSICMVHDSVGWQLPAAGASAALLSAALLSAALLNTQGVVLTLLCRAAALAALPRPSTAQPLWTALEKIIPDIRQRTELKLVGTPLTHARFLRRHRGSYGPAISARKASFPGPKTPLPGLFVCGDSTMPGIGVPAAAASGMICANTLAPVWSQLKLLDELGM